ncbi:DnaA regulatory inactivator Hda [Tepidimonas charontis]|uniref:DnaA regulatory inactivator Hda n=1 Tax=Tepidimonas charontis TaxID=2267262 RepID=A0A554XJL7_9BURK|nr:DnaA regulatory inactivator Hda [Tepidimonas charontis]TSE36027.1 DnaA regulatory inactivator Hda [Tepidimonas charontis]
MQQLVLDLGLVPAPSLDNFIARGNEAVVAHLREWLQAHPRAPLPIYLWGPPGSGKTHLLRAAAHALAMSGDAVGWLDARTTTLQAFDEVWSVVLLDDVHDYTPQQQAAAFNWLVNAQSPTSGPQRAVLAAGDRPPADLPLRDDLRSRLGWGHVFQLRPLDEAERRAVLQRAAAARGMALPDEVVEYLLARFARDLSSLMALLERLDGYALRTQRAITTALVRAMLADE